MALSILTAIVSIGAVVVSARRVGAGDGPVASGGTIEVAVAGRGGVPASGVRAVVLGVTVTNPTQSTFVTVWPTGSPRPATANLNIAAGDTLPSAVVAELGASGSVSIFNLQGTADLIVDVTGWFSDASAFEPVRPARVLDTRPGARTIDGRFAGTGEITAGETRPLEVVGRAEIPASAAGAVVLNVTAVDATAESFLTVWPGGTPRPIAASLTHRPGRISQNLVAAALGDGGVISMYNLRGSVHLVADVLGWLPAGAGFTSLAPARLLDTRPGHPTVDAVASGDGRVGPNSMIDLQIAGRGGVPSSGVSAVALNVTAAGASAGSFLVAFPSGTIRPPTANLTTRPGVTAQNLVVVPLGAGGQVSIYNLAGDVDLVVDVMGWFAPGDAVFASAPAARLLDTRRTTGELRGQLIGQQHDLVLGAQAERIGAVRLPGIGRLVIESLVDDQHWIGVVEVDDGTTLALLDRWIDPTRRSAGAVVIDALVLEPSEPGEVDTSDCTDPSHPADHIIGQVEQTAAGSVYVHRAWTVTAQGFVDRPTASVHCTASAI